MYQSFRNKIYPYLRFDGENALFICEKCGKQERLKDPKTSRIQGDNFRDAHKECKVDETHQS